jgi:hypothetical protein
MKSGSDTMPLFLLNNLLSHCQYQNKKALFTDPIFSEGFGAAFETKIHLSRANTWILQIGKRIKYCDIENILHPLYVVYVSTRYAYCIKLADVCKKSANICGQPGLRVLCSSILFYAFLILSNHMVSKYIFTF